MNTAISRMQFLRGDISGKKSPIRPPWSGNEIVFTNTCDSCGDCIDSCPTQIIQQGRGGHPVVHFEKGECLFCGDCVDACSKDALKKTNHPSTWSVKANIDNDNCIAFKNVECRSCYDPCENSSIKMTPQLGGVSTPLLNTSTCTGCGACFSTCPVKAISLNNKH